MRKHANREIYAFCPVCRTPIPVLTLTIELTGLVRRRCNVMVNGDATDYAAHMWMHDQQAKAQA